MVVSPFRTVIIIIHRKIIKNIPNMDIIKKENNILSSFLIFLHIGIFTRVYFALSSLLSYP